MSEKVLFLLDGMALVYRGHFAMIRNPRMTSKGMNTSAVFAFANTLLSIIEKGEPTHHRRRLSTRLSRRIGTTSTKNTKPSARPCPRI